MILTEKQARTKWCPMVRYKSLRGEGINRWAEDHETQPNPQLSRCIASECMMWVEIVEVEETESTIYESSKGGYCGLTRGTANAE